MELCEQIFKTLEFTSNLVEHIRFICWWTRSDGFITACVARTWDL